MTFGERLRLARKEAGMTQEGLARELGVSLSNVRNWEMRGIMPRTETTIEIARKLEVSLTWLLVGLTKEHIAADPMVMSRILEITQRFLAEADADRARAELEQTLEDLQAATLAQFHAAIERSGLRDLYVRDEDGVHPALAGAEAEDQAADRAVRDAEAEVPPAAEAADPPPREDEPPSRRSA